MIANGAPPEADLRAVACGDFSGLSQPLLVAARDMEQLMEFTFSEGLMCSEVRRFDGARAKYELLPENKILILLPAWDEHRRTAALVRWWADEMDRYTVQLPSPRVMLLRRGGGGVILAGACALWIVIYVIFRLALA